VHTARLLVEADQPAHTPEVIRLAHSSVANSKALVVVRIEVKEAAVTVALACSRGTRMAPFDGDRFEELKESFG
jgi:hypothetical protein